MRGVAVQQITCHKVSSAEFAGVFHVGHSDNPLNGRFLPRLGPLVHSGGPFSFPGSGGHQGKPERYNPYPPRPITCLER